MEKQVPYFILTVSRAVGSCWTPVLWRRRATLTRNFETLPGKAKIPCVAQMKIFNCVYIVSHENQLHNKKHSLLYPLPIASGTVYEIYCAPTKDRQRAEETRTRF